MQRLWCDIHRANEETARYENTRTQERHLKKRISIGGINRLEQRHQFDWENVKMLDQKNRTTKSSLPKWSTLKKTHNRSYYQQTEWCRTPSGFLFSANQFNSINQFPNCKDILFYSPLPISPLFFFSLPFLLRSTRSW